jgi:hypothetical protein
MVSVITALIFLVVANPSAYKATDWLFSKISLPTVDKCTVGSEMKGTPSLFGFILHAAVAFAAAWVVYNVSYACLAFSLKDKKKQ